jgi:hypothetical protein
MMLSREPLALTVVCALAGVASIAVALYLLIGGDIAEQGLDAIFLLIVCVTFAASFGLIMAKSLRKEQLKEMLSPRQSKPSTVAPDPKTDASGKAGNEEKLAEHPQKTAGKA